MKTLIHKLKLFFSRTYRRRCAIGAVERRYFEWFKVASRGFREGYIESHHMYVYQEIEAVIRDLSKIL